VELLIGCPVRNRAWILPDWFDYARKAAENAGVTPVFAFVIGRCDDDTKKIIVSQGDSTVFEESADEASWPKNNPERHWNRDRYHHMVRIRNQLLNIVRDMNPVYFLSLDSDILIHPQALENLLESIEGRAAVGGKAYLSAEHRRYPTYANITNQNNLYRPDAHGVFDVDVIMAIKLMTEEAYNVNYEWNQQGEDIGWSANCRANGIRLKWDGRVTSKHVMAKWQLNQVDERVGY